jgi:hypothetical protein
MISGGIYNMTDFAHPYSLEKFKSAFNMNNLELKNVLPVTISFDPNRYVPSGSPGVILKNNLLAAEKNQLVRVLFPFPTKRGLSPGIAIDVNYKNLHLLPQKNLIKNHKVKIIDTFKKDSLCDIGNYVTTNAAITFTFSDLNAASIFWKEIPYLCSIYKYTSFFYHFGGGRKRKNSKEKFIPFVSFIDLPYCIPVFDYRKIDGMGVCCGFINKNEYEENGKIISLTTIVDTLYFILSNHKANILYMDGIKLGDSAKIDTGILSYMSSFIEIEILYKKAKKQPNLLDKTEKELQENDVFCDTLKTEIKKSNNPIYYTISNNSTAMYTSSPTSNSTWV